MKHRFVIGFTLTGIISIGYLMPMSTAQNAPRGLQRRHDSYSTGQDIRADMGFIPLVNRAGAQGEIDKVPDILKEMRRNKAGSSLAVTGRALTRLNVQESIADFDKILAETEISVVRDWAKVMRARLLAQSPALPNNPARRFAVFLKEIDRTPEQFAQAIGAYNKKTPEEKSETYLMEVTALAELSDMIYRGDSEAWLKLPEIKALDVSGVRAAKYRMQFAKLPVEQRTVAIVDAIVEWEDTQPQVTAADAECRFLLQMAIDEGKQGAKAAVAKLKVLNSEREKHTKQKNGHTLYPAFGRLLTIVQDTKAKEFLPELEALELNEIDAVYNGIERVRIRLAHDGVGTLHFIEGLHAR